MRTSSNLTISQVLLAASDRLCAIADIGDTETWDVVSQIAEVFEHMKAVVPVCAASAIEARRAETPSGSAADESAVPHEDEADAQTAHPIQPRERK